MNTEEAYKRLCWHSRRGMLELDLMLGPFVRECYPGLDSELQHAYQRLLECEDQDLFRWLVGTEQVENKEIATIVQHIIRHARVAS